MQLKFQGEGACVDFLNSLMKQKSIHHQLKNSQNTHEQGEQTAANLLHCTKYYVATGQCIKYDIMWLVYKISRYVAAM